MTDELLSTVFGTKVDSTMLTEGGYVAPGSEAGYWAPSGTTALDSAHFFLPTSFTDPFSNTTTLSYDSYKFLVTSVTDALSNEVQAIYDYRLMTPTETIDPNLNHSLVAFDELGRVIAMALQGKSSAVGDTLANPTVSYEYELDRWTSSSLPNRVHVKAREQHYSDSSSTRFQESYTYSDGSGRVVMTKAKVDPGDAPALDGSGNLITVSADPRWVGSGKTVVNNKGNPVKQYEPFFSDTEEYQSEDAIVKWGVTPVFTYDALGRAKRIDLPNGTFRKSEWDAWTFTMFDENDTLGTGNAWYDARQSGATPTPSTQEQRAAAKAVLHANTPTIGRYDTMGRPFLVQASLTTSSTVDTRSVLDVESQVLSVTDALARVCETRSYAIGGTLLKTVNLDQGTRWMLDDVAGKPIRHWDSRGQTFRTVYDALRRPTHAYMKPGAGSEVLLQRHYFGEAASSPTTHNLLGKAIAVYDGAGKVETEDYDFKGNLLSGTRTLTSVYNATPDWSALASITDPTTAATTAATQLETETWTTSTTFDALNRPISSTSPDTSVSTYGYGQSAMLKTVDVNIRGASTATSFVSDIEYDAKGQRQSIDYGNGTSTAYTYDPLTFRLAELKTTRTSDSAIVQDLTYTFDPVGNVVEIDDGAQSTVYFANTVTDGTQLFEYDPLYRLVHAEGREHAGNVQINDASDVVASTTIPHVNDASAVKPYQEDYTYDVLGNITELAHTMTGSSAGSWTRTYTYCYQLTSGTDTTSIRLASNTWDSHSDATYTYDEHGSTLSMPHLAAIDYSPFDQMMHAEAGSQDAYYQYDAGGQRVRKMVGASGLLKERVYVGGYEVYREISLGTVQLERQTLHVMDGVKRIAMVETKTNDSGPVTTPVPRTRYQLTNHLDSAMAELDDSGNVFSYEEYHPYGTTAYRSGLNGLDVSAKRYRYCGAEKDDETGFYCMGMRYYCPWLTRWTTPDPLGLQAGINVYLYCRAGPVTFSDPSGLSPGLAMQFGGGEGIAGGQVGLGQGAQYSGHAFAGPGASASAGDGAPAGDSLSRPTDAQGFFTGDVHEQQPISGDGPLEETLSTGGGGGDVGSQVSRTAAANNIELRPGPKNAEDLKYMLAKIGVFGLTVAAGIASGGLGFWGSIAAGAVIGAAGSSADLYVDNSFSGAPNKLDDYLVTAGTGAAAGGLLELGGQLLKSWLFPAASSTVAKELTKELTGITTHNDGFATWVSVAGDAKATARIVEGPGGPNVTDIFSGSLPPGSGSQVLAAGLKAGNLRPGQSVTFSGIINEETLSVAKAGGRPADSLLGRLGAKSLDRLGLRATSFAFEESRGKLNLVIGVGAKE